LTTRLLSSWYDCGTVESLLETNRYLLQKIEHVVSNGKGCVVIPPVTIAPTANISNSIIGPYVTIGANVTVSDSRIGPYVSIGDNSAVSNSIIRDSILSQWSRSEEAMLASSLIGNQARVKGTFDRLTVGDTSEVDSSYNHQA
jgi:glucose-1-phosphate thymidylyltransferase